MDESINNIFFLKETIGKFKNELQKFLSDPNQQKHNILSLRQNIEELENNISKKERSIGNQILNNNLGTFIPIANRANNHIGYSNTKLNVNPSNLNFPCNNNGRFSPSSSQGLSNQSNANNCYNNFNPKTLSANFNNFNNTNNKNLDVKNRTFASNSNTSNQINNNTHYLNLKTGNTNIFANTGGLVGRNLNSANNPVGNSNTFNLLNNNNRSEIFANLGSIPESYYDLVYKAKKKEIIPEYSTPECLNGLFMQKTQVRSNDQKCEMQTFKSNLLLRRAKDELHSTLMGFENQYLSKIQHEKLMDKHNIITNKNTNFKKIKRAAGGVNYMDRSKIQKFAHHNKNLYNGVSYDQKQNPIITQDEIGKGILSMINRGLIPKTADLTPAFNRNGHPITLAKGEQLKEVYAKTKIRDEIEVGAEMDKVKYNFNNNGNNFFLTSGMNENQSMRDYINYNNVFYNNSASYENDTKDVVKTIPSLDMQNIAKDENAALNMLIANNANENIINSAAKSNLKTVSYMNENDGEFIKAKDNRMNFNNNQNIIIEADYQRNEIIIKGKSPEDDNDNNPIIIGKENENAIKTLSKENLNLITNKNLEEQGHIGDASPALKKMVYLVKMLIFKNFSVIEDEEYQRFILSNYEKQGTHIYLIQHFEKLFRKLNITYAEVDIKKMEKLADDELKNVTNKDLLACLTEKDLKAKGFDNHKTLHTNLKEAFVLRIQKFYRRYKAILNYYELRTKIRKIKKIQRSYRICRIFKKSHGLVEEKRMRNLIEWRLMMNNFKANWSKIKKGKRIEIHINSLYYTRDKNLTMEKYAIKENNQLNRLINLLDPNVEIIYIAPFPLGNEVLSYYFSILSTLGVDDAKERFHLIVPEELESFPGYSLTQVLMFSCISLSKIRKVIKGKMAYIVPGVISKYDLDLSIFMECPILVDEFELTKTLFTKSGSKRVFELTNMAFPISAWDIRNEEEFYNSLIDLIKKYITVNIWIFKMDTDVNGRGIAYIQLDKIKDFVELRKERQNGIIDDDTFELGLREFIKKSVSKNAEMITPNLYTNFKAFLKQFCENQGIIESCPTNSLSGITGSPAISMFVEPDGNVELIGTYDKINLNFFRNIAALAPQSSIPNLNIDLITERLGKYLYKQGIIGYITIEYITFMDGPKTLFWAIDLKYGFSDIISSLKFCDALDNFSANNYANPMNSHPSNSYSNNVNINTYSNKDNTNNTNLLNQISPNNNSLHSSNFLSKNESSLSINLKYYMDSQHKFRFILPVIIHSEIASLKMRELVSMFRNELLVYDLEKRNGIVFNLPDIIQCGMFGICGITRNKEDCYKLFESSVNLIKNIISKKENKNISLSIELKTDIIDSNELVGRIKYFMKNFK